MANTTENGVPEHDSTEDHEEPAAKKPRVEDLSPSAEGDSARAQQSESGNDPSDINEVLSLWYCYTIVKLFLDGLATREKSHKSW